MPSGVTVAFSAGLIKLYRPALIHLNDIWFVVYLGLGNMVKTSYPDFFHGSITISILLQCFSFSY